MSKFSKKQLESILAEVETEVADLLKSQTADLKKAVKGDEEEGSAPAEASPEAPPAEGSAPAEASPAEGSAPAEASPEAPPAEGSAPAEASPEAPPAEESAPAEGAEGGDMAALEGEYAKLPLEELKAHYLAAKAALFAQMQQGGEQQMAPPAAPEAPPAPAPAMKAEIAPAKSSVPCCGSIKGSGETEPKVAKSEQDSKEIKELKAQIETLTKAVTLIVEQPIRKAATSLSFVPKAAEEKSQKQLSKSEVTQILSKKTLDPKLSKSDRQLVTDYYEGNIGLEKIAHLLQ